MSSMSSVVSAFCWFVKVSRSEHDPRINVTMNRMVEGHASAAMNLNKKKAPPTAAAGTVHTMRFRSPSQTSRTVGSLRAKTVDNVTASKPVTMTSVTTLGCGGFF